MCVGEPALSHAALRALSNSNSLYTPRLIIPTSTLSAFRIHCAMRTSMVDTGSLLTVIAPAAEGTQLPGHPTREI